MNPIKNAAELREAKQKRADIAIKLKDTNKPSMSAEERAAWDALKAEWSAIDSAIQDYDAASERNNALADIDQRAAQSNQERQTNPPVPGRTPAQARSSERLHVFANLGEQLASARNQALTGQVDERLNQVNAEARALGLSEGIGNEAGFAVQTDFAGAIFESSAQEGDLLPLVDHYPVSAGSNSAHWIEASEDDVSETVFGGVKVYWAGEGKAVAASKTEIQEQKIDLEKLMGFAYTSEETMQDTTFASRLFTVAFGLAISRKVEGGIVSGTGLGQMTGILKSPALVSVAEESGQANDTVVVENFAHMWGRLLPRARKNAVWLMHPDVEEILPLMSFPVGTGGVPIFLPAGGISGSPLSTLYGRPIIPMDHCSALGDKGDVILTDPKQYAVFDKGGVQEMWSAHVAFLTAENCYRVIFRVNGRPKMSKSITIKNSANKRSAYVTLDAR